MRITTTEAMTNPRTASRGGSISTEEIRARIEAMFADDRDDPQHPTR